MHKHVSLMLLSGALVSLSAVALAEDENVQVRLIQGAGAAGALNITVGNQALFNNVAPNTVTGYMPLSGANDNKLKVTAAGGQEVDVDGDNELDDDNTKYTIIALSPDPKDNDAKTQVKVVKTTKASTGVPQDKAHVSLINASNGVGAADLLVGDDKVHAGVNPGGFNGPDAVSPGTLRVMDGRTNQEIPITNSATLTAGKSYTVVVLGPNNAQLVDDSAPASGMASGASSSAPSRTMGGAAAPGAAGSGTMRDTPGATGTAPGSATGPDAAKMTQSNMSAGTPTDTGTTSTVPQR